MTQPNRVFADRLVTGASKLRASAADFVKTNFDTKVSAELWLNLHGKDYRLVGKTIRIGRAPDNDIVLDHKSVSRYHAILTLQNGQVVIEDLKSRNGIVVNGSSMHRAELTDSDAIKIGDLYGLFFVREKKETTPNKMATFVFAHGTSMYSKFQALDATGKKKVMAFAAAMLVVLGLWMSGGRRAQVVSTIAGAEAKPLAALDYDRRAYDRCLEKEGLGNFRQALECFKLLPLAAEVQAAVSRITKRQNDLVSQRFKEGSQAFENYYYDIAILKWQEVLLVASDESDLRTKALAGIQKAEERKRMR